MAKSIYQRGGNGMTTGGLDGYLGPEAQDHSNLPEHIQEADVDAVHDAACTGMDQNEAVLQIAKAENEHQSKSS